MPAKKEKEVKTFADMTVTEIVKEYLGNQRYFQSYNGWSCADVVSAIGTLSSMIKNKDTEITYLKDKVEFLERIINQVFKQEK